MPRRLRIAYFAHSLRSDWNNGNAHFLRGLLNALGQLGHAVRVYETDCGWSIDNLQAEAGGGRSLQQVSDVYPHLVIRTYEQARTCDQKYWSEILEDTEFVVLHEWNPPELAATLLAIRDSLGFQLVFHDTHHRASSTPASIAQFGLHRFDGVLAFGESLRRIYMEKFGITRVWTLHEAADTDVFRPFPGTRRMNDVVWIGNWGDEERSTEIKRFLLEPAAALPGRCFAVYGVRYPELGLDALHQAGIRYGGYLANLDAPAAYAASRLTVHIPRQQYASAMEGIPTIRVFEALACGIPLLSVPWPDVEHLFREGDFIEARNASEMRRAMEYLLSDTEAAEAQALRGLETVRGRHTCRHRAEQLVSILTESFS